MIHLRSR